MAIVLTSGGSLMEREIHKASLNKDLGVVKRPERKVDSWYSRM